MTKGQAIRHLISKGHDDQFILSHVATTLNSIRWHRSKMREAPRTETSTVAIKAAGHTVGAVAEEWGLAETIREGLRRLNVDVEAFYGRLASWHFVTNAKVTGRFGQCRHRSRTIEVHAKLLGLPEDFKQTFLHEVAHALDALINLRSSRHGGPWQRVMMALGQPPIRCGGHTAEASEALREIRKQRAVETWVCGGCGEEAPIMKKRRYPASAYRHRGCGGRYHVKGHDHA